jgi:6-phosphofructo-2-kinase/fructose-2,6-biphosphatase 2
MLIDRGKEKADHSATYFNHSNTEGNLAREKLAEESLESLITWLKKEGNVGIMGEPSSVRLADRQMLQTVHSRGGTY